MQPSPFIAFSLDLLHESDFSRDMAMLGFFIPMVVVLNRLPPIPFRRLRNLMVFTITPTGYLIS